MMGQVEFLWKSMNDQLEVFKAKHKVCLSLPEDSTKHFGPLGSQIEEHQQHIKDLGVIMSNDASFSEHIRQVSMKARKYG